jgi:hypothetical protein
MGQTLEGAVDFFRRQELSFLYDAHLAAYPNIVTHDAQPPITFAALAPLKQPPVAQ